MKRTDQERIERELRRREKHAKVAPRPAGEGAPPAETVAAGGLTVSEYVHSLLALLQYDAQQIYNTRDDDNVFELLLTMKADLPEKHWETVLRSAIQKTKVVEKDLALTELKALLAD